MDKNNQPLSDVYNTGHPGGIVSCNQDGVRELVQHQVILGKTRAGMSAFMNDLQRQMAATPSASTVIVDKGSSSGLLAGLLRRL